MNDQIHQRKNKITLLLIFIVFIIPVVISWWFLEYSDHVVEGKKSNYGTLIHPARPLPDVSVINAKQHDQTRHLHGIWTLFYIVPAKCEDTCKKILYSLHQIEQLVGKDSLRVQRVVWLNQAESATEIVEHYPGQWLLELSNNEREAFLNQFKITESDDPVTSGNVYIIDPLGNLMMQYDPDFDPYGLIRDLKRLLKASKIG